MEQLGVAVLVMIGAGMLMVLGVSVCLAAVSSVALVRSSRFRPVPLLRRSAVGSVERAQILAQELERAARQVKAGLRADLGGSWDRRTWMIAASACVVLGCALFAFVPGANPGLSTGALSPAAVPEQVVLPVAAAPASSPFGLLRPVTVTPPVAPRSITPRASAVGSCDYGCRQSQSQGHHKSSSKKHSKKKDDD